MIKYLIFLLLLFSINCGEAPEGWDGGIVSPSGDTGSSDEDEPNEEEPEELPSGLFGTKFSETQNDIWDALEVYDDCYSFTIINRNITDGSSCVNTNRVFQPGNYSVSYTTYIDYNLACYPYGADNISVDYEINYWYSGATVYDNNECIFDWGYDFVENNGFNVSEYEYASQRKIVFNLDFTNIEQQYIKNNNGDWEIEENPTFFYLGNCE